MQFESNIKRNYFLNAFLGLTPDTAISIGIAYFTDSGALGFMFSMIGLQCLYLFIWLKDTIWKWLFFKLRGKKLMVQHIEKILKSSNFPAPDDYEKSVDSYLNNIIENDELETVIRIKAAAEIGAMNYPLAYQRIQERIRINMAYEEALENYKKHLEYKSS